MSLDDLRKSRPGGDEAEIMERLPGWDVGLRTRGRGLLRPSVETEDPKPSASLRAWPEVVFLCSKEP